jgi:hypothetical protein
MQYGAVRPRKPSSNNAPATDAHMSCLRLTVRQQIGLVREGLGRLTLRKNSSI